MPAYLAWAIYSGSILGREIEDPEDKFLALSDDEQVAWVKVAIALDKDEQ